MPEAKNVAAIRKWIAAYRPDLMIYYETILREESWSGHAQALFLMLTIGFSAGRDYQRENPDDDSP